MTLLKDDLMALLLTGGYEMKLQVGVLNKLIWFPKLERKQKKFFRVTLLLSLNKYVGSEL